MKLDIEPNTAEIFHALAVFIMAFSATCPQSLRDQVSRNIRIMAANLDKDGLPNVGTLCINLARAVELSAPTDASATTPKNH
ncbi:MAG: hypothetical protein AAB932_01340 [Patescibacteria group bacterium]